MVWATVSSQSCFCWLYRASPSLGTKNIINRISVLTLWCPCVVSSLVLLEVGFCYDRCLLLTKLCYPLPCLILYSKAKLACYSRYLLTSNFGILIPYDEKNIFFLVCLLVLQGLTGLHRTIWLFSFSALVVGTKTVNYCDVEWFAFKINQDHVLSKRCKKNTCSSLWSSFPV